MIKKAVRIRASLSIVLLLQSGCATVQRTQEANGTSIVVEELVKND